MTVGISQPPRAPGGTALSVRAEVAAALHASAARRGLRDEAELDRILTAALGLRPGTTVFEVTMTAEAEVIPGDPQGER